MLPGLFPDVRRDVAFPIIGSAGLFVLFIGGGALYQALVGGSAERVVTAMLIDAIMVIGIQVYIGNTGVLSFGHIGFGAIAGYAFAVFAINPTRKGSVIANAPFGLAKTEMGDLAAMVLAVLVTLVAAVIIGLGLARSGARSGAVSATVITLGLLFGTHEVATSWTNLTGGDRVGLSFSIGESLDGRLPVYLALAGAIVAARLFAQSRSGRLAAAAREDNLAARAMGANPLVQQMVALLLSVVIVSVAASLRVYEVGTILPDFFFFDYTLLTLVMLIVGGRNSVTGALLGVGLITAGRELARELGTEGFEFFGIGLDGAPLDWLFREGLPRVFLGGAMLAFMLYRPTGMLNDWELDEWLYARFGRRRENAPPRMAEVHDIPMSHLSATGIDVSFGGFKALDDAGIEVDRGEIVGIIGPNGAGKTTFVNVITGMVAPTAGAFAIDGVDLSNEPSFALARAGIVRTFQNLRLFGALTVRENVEVSALLAREHRPDEIRPEIDAIVAEAGLWEHRHRRADELDYGNSRRLELARAAAMAPSFLLLDEPTSGMSDSESLEMVEHVRHMAATVGAGVIVIDHDLAFITGISDRIYVFDQGRVIAEGTPDQVQADPLVRAAYLGATGG
jgi:branched-chain amino acid transport system permease protein